MKVNQQFHKDYACELHVVPLKVMVGYWLYVCEDCDIEWCGEDPLLYEGPQDCFCGKEIEPGFVEDWEDEDNQEFKAD